MYSYKVFDQFGDLLEKGSASECAAELGLTTDGFRSALARMLDGVIGKFVIEEFGGPQDTEQDRIDLAKQWDRFCEPLRKKYGIEVK